MKIKAPYAERLAEAEHLRDLLKPVCERIEIAGSLRRKKPEIGDIELVIIPKLIIGHDLLDGEYVAGSQLEEHLKNWNVPKIKNGPAQKQLDINGVQVDLFICTPETWAVTLLLRTGSAEFSKKFVTPRKHGGFMFSGYRIHNSRLEANRVPQDDIVEEEDLFNALSVPWIPPEERD